MRRKVHLTLLIALAFGTAGVPFVVHSIILGAAAASLWADGRGIDLSAGAAALVGFSLLTALCLAVAAAFVRWGR